MTDSSFIQAVLIGAVGWAAFQFFMDYRSGYGEKSNEMTVRLVETLPVSAYQDSARYHKGMPIQNWHKVAHRKWEATLVDGSKILFYSETDEAPQLYQK